jgi:hypothetical protein
MIDMIFSSLNFDFFTRALLGGKLDSPMVLAVGGYKPPHLMDVRI